MTPTIALIAVSIIAAGLCVAVGIMQWRINQLNAENDRERARHEVAETQLKKATDERDHALNEAKNEYDLRRQAERNLAEANDETDTWRVRAMRAENALDAVKVTRDPKTGRMVSTKSKPRPTAQEMNEGLAAFDAMMGNAIEQLQGLTVQTESALNMGRTLKLCDEVKQSANEGL